MQRLQHRLLVLPRPQPTDGGGEDPVDAFGVAEGAPDSPRVPQGLSAIVEDALDLEEGDEVECEHGYEHGDEEDEEGVAWAGIDQDPEEGPG